MYTKVYTKMRVKIDIIGENHRPSISGEIPLSIRLTQNKKRKYIRIGINIKPQHWDSKKNKLKPNCPDREYLESIITDNLSKYQKQILEFQTIGKEYSINQLIEAIDKPLKNITVSEYLKTIIQDLIKEDKVGNASHYQALFNSLEKFTKIHQLQFIDIDTKFLNKYEIYLRSIGNKGNSISIKMRTLRAAYNKAMKDSIIKKDYYPFEEYNISKLKESTNKRSITKDDILNIINFDTKSISKRPQSLMQFSKDIFLFSYFGCGINIVDIAYLKQDNIKLNRITYKRHKTGKQISFQIHPYAKDIIFKYESNNTDNYIFPIIDDNIHITTEQKFRRIKKITYVVNKNLKKIGEAIGLQIPLTTYVARHSYATVLKRSGVSTSIISESLGHSNEKITQIYLDSFENSQIDEAMKNLL